MKVQQMFSSCGEAAWFKQGDWTPHAELCRLSGQETTGLKAIDGLGPASVFSLVRFLLVLNGCNATQSFSWSCVPWPHLPLPIPMGWSAPFRRWRVVLKEDLSWDWEKVLAFLGNETSLPATKPGDSSVHYIHILFTEWLSTSWARHPRIPPNS